MTMAPLVVKGKVLVGNSGGEFGVRGWLTALDAGTGKLAWRAYATGPDKDVLIGPRFKPFYPQDRGPDLGVSTWPGDAWKTGGGGAGAGSPTIRRSTSSTTALPTRDRGIPSVRPGDNKWTAGIFARDPDTGEAVWAYQWSPHDLFDYDGINEQLLLDLAVGRPDAARFWSAPSATATSTSSTADRRGAFGRPVRLHHHHARAWISRPAARSTNPEKAPRTGEVVRGHLPRRAGRQGLAAVLLLAAHGAAVHPAPESLQGRGSHRGELHRGHAVRRRDREDVRRGPAATAESSPRGIRSRGRRSGRSRRDLPVWSGTRRRRRATSCSTARWTAGSRRVDAQERRALWRFKTGIGNHRAADHLSRPGRQAVRRGAVRRRRWAGAVVAGGLDTRDSSAALGFVNAMRICRRSRPKGGMLYVFALP